MPANNTPSEFSRDIVQVVLRDSTSILFDWSALNRAGASSGTKATFEGSSKMAAATARQKSTSKPDQLFLSSALEKPSKPWLTPQFSTPRSLTAFRVWALPGQTRRIGNRRRNVARLGPELRQRMKSRQIEELPIDETLRCLPARYLISRVTPALHRISIVRSRSAIRDG